MKLVSVTLRPDALGDVQRTLLSMGIDDISATLCKTASCHPEKAKRYGGDAYLVGDIHAVTLDIVISDRQVPLVIDAIALAAGPGHYVVHDLIRSICIDIGTSPDETAPHIPSMIEESILILC